MKAYSISAHFGKKMSRDHNIRNRKVTDAQKHIDPNGYHVTLEDMTVRQAYAEVFGQAVLDYNAKQTRSDRRIPDYLDKVLKAHRNNPTRNPATSQEVIFTIGNREHHPNRKRSEEALTAFLVRWKEENPNVHVFGAYFHADEPGSAPHLHVDYILVKRENKRGLAVQVGQEGALKEMGYFTTGTKKEGNLVTSQTRWQEATRELLRAVSREKGLIVQDKGMGKENAKHLDTELFKKKTELNKLKSDIEKAKADLSHAKEEEKRTRSKAQRNEKRVAEANEKVAEAKEEVFKLNEHVDYYKSLEHVNDGLRSENSKLRRALRILQKGFDLVEKAAKTLFAIDVWKSTAQTKGIKSELYEGLGDEYEDFQSIRHDPDLFGTPLAPHRFRNDNFDR